MMFQLSMTFLVILIVAFSNFSNARYLRIKVVDSDEHISGIGPEVVVRSFGLAMLGFNEVKRKVSSIYIDVVLKHFYIDKTIFLTTNVRLE